MLDSSIAQTTAAVTQDLEGQVHQDSAKHQARQVDVKVQLLVGHHVSGFGFQHICFAISKIKKNKKHLESCSHSGSGY